jgi:hypothetical protein
MKVAAMINTTGAAVYILAERTWATAGGVVDQCAIAPVGAYAEKGIATGWVNASNLTRFE